MAVKRERWLVAFITKETLEKHLFQRTYDWQTTLYWIKPSMGRDSALKIARERGCPLTKGGKLIWYPCWPRNVEGKPRRMGAGTAYETMKFD